MSLSTSPFRAAKTLLLVAVVLVAAELIIRVQHFGSQALYRWGKFDPSSLVMTSNVQGYFETKLGWRLKANLRTWYKGQAFSTNEHGFRDRNRSVIKTPGTMRIAVLGRSYEMGTGVSDRDVWPAILEQRYFSDRAVEVMNFSVEAYSLSQVELTYHRFAKNFHPDFVIIPIYYEEIDTIVPLAALPLPTALQKWLSLSAWLDHLYLPRVLQFASWSTVLKHGSQDWDFQLGAKYLKNKGKDASTEPYTTVAQRLVGAVLANDSQVILAPMPRIVRTSTALYAKGKRLFEVYSKGRDRVRLLTELEPLGQELTTNSIAIPGDPHFNAEVQRRIAEVIYGSVDWPK